MKKLVIEFSNERLITPGGSSLVGQMLGKSNFIKKCNNMKVDGKRSQSQIKLTGQESLKSKRAPKTKHPVKRRRIRTVIENLIQIAGYVTTHGRRIALAIGCSNVWRHAFMDVYNRFALA